MLLISKQRVTKLYERADGKKPFLIWFENLDDSIAKARLLARVERAKFGLFGDYRDLKGGVFELRDNYGPGYRIYFGVWSDQIILLLIGGNKSSQNRDISKAREYWSNFLERNIK